MNLLRLAPVLLPALVGLAACAVPDKQVRARDLESYPDPTCRNLINSADIADCQRERARERTSTATLAGRP